MKAIEDAVICVRDHGLFVHVAQCIAKEAKLVYYVGPDERVMPRLADYIVGDGFDNIVRVPDIWQVKDQCDAFCFTDIGFTGEQLELVKQKKAVWGHHGADELEYAKGKFLDALEDMGLEVPPHTTVVGLSKLRELLWDDEDKYVKVSRYRGDWETFHWRNRTLDEASMDCAAYRLGPMKDKIKFYVFDKIDSDVEDGIDTWCIDGVWPKMVFHGMEQKDKSLLGAMQRMSDVNEEVRGVNTAIAPILEEYGYRGAFSTEVRLTDTVSYFIDPTMRFGSPPSQIQTCLITNLADVIYRGAHGEVVEPEFEDTIGAQALITSDREKDEWLTFDMDKELRPWVKASFACQVDGIFTVAPNPLENWAGWLCATGSDISSTIETLKERKEMLPAGFDCDLTSLCDCLRELEDAKEHDVHITDGKIPKPESVI